MNNLPPPEVIEEFCRQIEERLKHYLYVDPPVGRDAFRVACAGAPHLPFAVMFVTGDGAMDAIEHARLSLAPGEPDTMEARSLETPAKEPSAN